jgi:hypothetical protein
MEAALLFSSEVTSRSWLPSAKDPVKTDGTWPETKGAFSCPMLGCLELFTMVALCNALLFFLFLFSFFGAGMEMVCHRVTSSVDNYFYCSLYFAFLTNMNAI